MQREIDSLKAQLAEKSSAAYNASLQRVASDGYPSPASTATLTMQRLEDVALSGERLGHLFSQYVGGFSINYGYLLIGLGSLRSTTLFSQFWILR